MIYIIMGGLGGAYGAYAARKNGGNRKDIAQYAASFFIAFALLGFVLTVLLDRWFITGG